MSNLLDYQGTVILKNDLGLQEVYSSQNYGTFYSIYLTLDAHSPDPKKPNIIELTNIKFKMINYKGIINMGLVNAKHSFGKKDEYLEFEVDIRAMERNRDFPLVEDDGSSKIITIDTSVTKKVIITRWLLKMNQFNPNLNPNHPNNVVFDDEFYYRDGLEFNPKVNDRKVWPGMDGVGGSSSGKRCYQITLKIQD